MNTGKRNTTKRNKDKYMPLENEIRKTVEKYVKENQEITLAKEAMHRSQTVKDKRASSLLKRSAYLRMQ